MAGPQDVLMSGAIRVLLTSLKIDPVQFAASIEGTIGAINDAAAGISAIRRDILAIAERLDRLERMLAARNAPGPGGSEYGPDASTARNGHAPTVAADAGAGRGGMADPKNAD